LQLFPYTTLFRSPNLKEQIRGLRAHGLPDVHEDHGPALATLRHESALLRQGVLGEMTRVAFRGVAAPVDDEIRPILDFAQRARDLATQLGGYLSGAVSKRRVAVDHSSDHLGQSHGFALGLARDVAQPV